MSHFFFSFHPRSVNIHHIATLSFIVVSVKFFNDVSIFVPMLGAIIPDVSIKHLNRGLRLSPV